MAASSILVTGGAGFIGGHMARALVDDGYEVRILDNLAPQVHGDKPEPPEGLDLIRGDVRDVDAWSRALEGVEVVFHQAAAVGVGQSMYDIRRYVEVNSLGTANLLQYLADGDHGVRRLIVASSMSIYGEGSYRCRECGTVDVGLRSNEDLEKGIWEPSCPGCGGPLQSKPTDEEKPLNPTSIYATTKRDQEEMCLQIGKAYGIGTVALRYFNVYGPGQSLSNPYTGVCAIFSSRVKSGNPPIVFEDGRQTRDFVSVQDIVQANMLALKTGAMDGQYFNVGTGRPISILQVARTISRIHGSELEPVVTGDYRAGDIRHCYADISRIAAHGYKPRVGFQDGMEELARWSRGQEAQDRFDEASGELEKRGLISR
jgi:dTDP-L-rhamnose 4-epimerase